MKHYQGSCHCHAITFAFSAPEIVDGMQCNCSICKRKGAIMSNFTIPPEAMEVTIMDDALSTYQFGSKVAKHHFCKMCGIFTFVETRLNPGEYRVNLGCVDDLDLFTLPTTLFDGQSL
ncbi:MAG: GFA family protein [Chloroflexota bacterium]